MSQRVYGHPTAPQVVVRGLADKALLAGVLGIYPTETSYAIACHIGDKNALERLTALRKLPKDHQFTLICRDLSELGQDARVGNGA